MNDRNEKAYLGLLRSWERGGAAEVCAQIRELFTDTTVWVQRGYRARPDSGGALILEADVAEQGAPR